MSYKPKPTKTYLPKIAPAPVQYKRPFKPMLAQEGQRADLGQVRKEAQRKLDGTRTFVIKDGSSVRLIGARNWVNDYGKNHPELLDDIRKLPVDHCVLDSEFTFFRKGTDKDVFLTALAGPDKIKELGLEAKLMVFDVLWVDDDNLEHLPFTDRDEILDALVPKGLEHVVKVKTVLKDKEKFFEDLKAKQGEGVVLKEEESPYRQGVRSPEWLKIKHWKDDSAVVVGYTKGTGARAATFGALVLAKKDKNGQWRYVGKASGLKDQEIRDMLTKMKRLGVSKSPLTDAPPNLDVKGWVDPKVVVDVKYYEKTPAGIYRMPDFLRERTDIRPGDCKL